LTILAGMAENTKAAESDDSGRVRLIIDSDEIVNAAVQLRASKESVAQRRRVNKSEVVLHILRRALVQEIEEITQFESASEGPKSRRKGS
jgi:hypothetical protein